MKTLTPKEAAQAVLDGKAVRAEDGGIKWIIKSTDGYLFSYKNPKDKDYILPSCFSFYNSYTYTLYEKPKQEEKKYRWLLKNLAGQNLVTDNYIAKDKVKERYFSEIIARLDCLDDLKDKPYYTEEF